MPERGYTLDAAIEYGRGGWFAGVTPFATFFDRFVFLEPAPRFSILPEGGQLYAYTQAQAQLVGGEVRLAWQSAQWQQNGLRVGIAADIVRGQNLTSQLPLPFMPPPSILFELTYRKARLGPLRQLRLHSEAQAFAAQNRVARNEAPTPAYTLVNAAIGFCAPWPNLPIRLEVQVQNLLNARYMRHLSRYRILNLPEPGRNVVVALSIPLSYRKGQKPNGAATTAQ
jgi:iron complex outermembrane receptor protein